VSSHIFLGLVVRSAIPFDFTNSFHGTVVWGIDLIGAAQPTATQPAG
jgi:hypothetical protein